MASVAPLKGQNQAEHIILEAHSPHVLSIAKPVRGTRAILVGVILKWEHPSTLSSFTFSGSPVTVIDNKNDAQVNLIVPWLCENKLPMPIQLSIPPSQFTAKEFRKKLDWVFPIDLGFTPTTYLIEIFRQSRDHQFIHKLQASIHLVIF